MSDSIVTVSGIEFFPFEPRVAQVRVEDIAHALSNSCRFTGHTYRFYSVAQHCVRVSLRATDNPLKGLFHDAAEAYMCDLPSPVKRRFPAYKAAENVLLRCIYEAVGLDADIKPHDIKRADELELLIEQRDLMPPLASAHIDTAALADQATIVPMTPNQAYRAFMARYHELTRDERTDADMGGGIVSHNTPCLDGRGPWSERGAAITRDSLYVYHMKKV